jgi:hypothetical protein
MDKGRIVEQGTYAQLAVKGGLFSKLLAASQSSPTPGTELPYEAAFAGTPSNVNASAGSSGMRAARNSPERA